MSHFNQAANEWDSPGKIKMMQDLASEVLKNIDSSKKYRIMDFGCGTGLFGLGLLGIASKLVGIDTSSGMLEVFEKKAEKLNHVYTKNINLEEKDLQNEEFDLIVSSMAFHHLNEPGKMIQKLKKLLSKEGKLLIVDLDKEDGTFHPNNDKMGVKHFGFSKETLENWAKEANLKISQYKHIRTPEKNGRIYPIFMCEFSH